MKTVAIHQPEYFPLLGYLNKAKRADLFVLLDHVQFSRDKLEQRARMNGPSGGAWMTIPFIHRFPQAINEVEIPSTERWQVKHRKTLQAFYGRASGWYAAVDELDAYFGRAFPLLADATIASVEMLFTAFGITTPVVRSSTVGGLSGHKSELVLDICQKLNATCYLSGRGGSTYLDAAAFQRAGVEIEIQSYQQPEYRCLRPVQPEDARRLSALDAWLNLGDDAAGLI